MNSKDCEHIGYLLASRKSIETLRDDLIKMDPRIGEHLEGFDEVLEQDEETKEVYERLLFERFGQGWPFAGGKTPEILKELWDRAASEVRRT